ncbi:hypothetical protein ED733_002540 [Metarhizium rileyi]|uniref:Uncharacterized protein n=1 Tax=Metarhizium rileyi (strain RCEF 4871) TaxID=1649241 RepID=A0A5C6GDG7_METRR|nr:hypothetical protein ED733_002540 [Metarhizium rileyi]
MTVEGSIRQPFCDSRVASEHESEEGCMTLTEKDTVARFDRLVDAGIINYDYTQATEYRRIAGLDFEFRVSKVLKDKPADTTSPPSTGNGSVVPKQRPGSDINTHGSEIGQLDESHFLTFNGYSCYRPHYLILTLDGHRRQWEPLCIDDFRAVYAFFEAYGEDYLVFFNGGVEAGCSRLHKHLQAIPNESFDGNPWRNLDENSDAMPFTYFEKKLGMNSNAEASLAAYTAALEMVQRTRGCEISQQDRAPPHNVIMDRDRILVIPRRAAGNGLVGVNAMGMLGMIWTQSEESLQLWLDAGPHTVLEHVGFPRRV